MIVERKKDELVIRIPGKIDPDGLQNFIDYLKVKTIIDCLNGFQFILF